MNHVYETATGKLISSTSLDVTDLRTGLAVKASDKTGIWNTSALDFDPLPERKVVSKTEFLRLFTDLELEAIIGASRGNNRVAVFIKRFEMSDSIDLRESRIITSVNGMETLNLIGSGRASEILA